MADITVVIPTIPSRVDLLERAKESAERQTLAPAGIVVSPDTTGAGAAQTRHAGLACVTTPWVAFLDDDDEFKIYHLELLYEAAVRERADYVFSWYEVIGGTDPRAEEFGLPWDPKHPRQTTVTTLVRTDLALQVGGFIGGVDDPNPICSGEDWLFTKRINDAGGRIYHLPQKTWLWHHHAHNTSGLAIRAFPRPARERVARAGKRRVRLTE